MESEQKDALTPQEQLVAALDRQDLDAFRDLLRSGRANANHRYGKPHYGTCLEVAARRPFGKEFAAELLQYVKPNVNVIVPEPVHHAAKRGHADVLAVLLADKRTKANAHDSESRTALHYACMHVTLSKARGFEGCVKLLMGWFSPADINHTDAHGYSAIHAAAKYKPNRNSTGRRGTSEADPEASVTDEDEIWEARKLLVKVILDLGRDVLDIDSGRALGRTAREDLMLRFPELEKHLPAGADALHADPHSALANALRDGRIDMFRALLQETDPDGTPTLDPNHWFGAPLHATCLEMACKKRGADAFVRALLAAGADPNIANKLDEKFPIHVACEKGYEKQLNALFQGSEATDPNARDKLGNTSLHYIIEKWSNEQRLAGEKRNCLECLLTRDNIDVNRKNNKGLTALMLALEYKNKYAVKTIVSKKRDALDLSAIFKGKELRVVIAETLPDLKDQVLSSDGLQSQEDESEWFDLLHITREDEFVERLHEKTPTNLSMDDKKFTLLQRAACYGMEKAVKSLLDKGADANVTFKGNLSPPLVLASFHRHKGVVQIFLNYNDLDVNAVDAKGNTALHYAARVDADLDTVVNLLRRGADTKKINRLGKTAMGNAQVQSLLDQCVSTNGKNALEEDYELILDYRLLAPGYRGADASVSVSTDYSGVPRDDCHFAGEDNGDDVLESEMEFLHLMSKNEELNALLDHPVARSFLDLKWSLVKPLAYFNIGVYVGFMVFLNVFIINSGSLNSGKMNYSEGYMHNDTEHYKENTTDAYRENVTEFNENKNSIDPASISLGIAWFSLCVTFLLWTVLCFREVVQFTFDQQKYIGSVENYLDWSILLFGFVSLTMPVIQPQNSLLSVINVLAIMLSCAELLMLLGRISNFAKYIEMLKVVLYNYSLPLVSYCVIIIAFGLSFHTLFRESKVKEQMTVLKNGSVTEADISSNDFSSWHTAIVKSLVMMIGELDFNSYPDRSPVSIVLFVVFVLLVTVVLLNLLIGLAVSDTQKIEDMAQQLRLKTRVELVLYTESILVNMNKSQWRMLRKLSSLIIRKSLRGAILFPGVASEGREARVKPNVQNPDLLLGKGRAASTQVQKELLDRATLIISRRSSRMTAKASEVNLADVSAKLDRVLKLLAGRSAADERAQVRLDRALSVPDDGSVADAPYANVFSEGDEG